MMRFYTLEYDTESGTIQYDDKDESMQSFLENVDDYEILSNLDKCRVTIINCDSEVVILEGAQWSEDYIFL